MDNGEAAFRELWQWMVSKWDLYAFAEDSWPTRILGEGLDLAQELSDKYLTPKSPAEPQPTTFNPDVCKQCGSDGDWLFQTIQPRMEWNNVRCVSCGIIYRQRMYRELGQERWEAEDIVMPYPQTVETAI